MTVNTRNGRKARASLDTDGKLVLAATRISPELMSDVVRVSRRHKWRTAQTLREAIELGMVALNFELASSVVRVGRRKAACEHC